MSADEILALIFGEYTVIPSNPTKPTTPTDPEPTTPTEPTEPELPFGDVDKDHMFYEDIKYVYENNLMQGNGSGFLPENIITRGELVTVLYRVEGTPVVTGESTFGDVANGKYYTEAVIWAAENGIVLGGNDGNFHPDETITREQLVAILYRYAQYKGCDVSVGEDTNILSYTDFDQISEYAIPAFQWACGAGIVNGTSASTLSPKGGANRGQIAAVLHRYCVWIG